MDLGVVIVSWNVRELLRGCLTSLRADLAGTPSRVVVVDSASSDGSAQMVRDEFLGVELVPRSDNLGYVKGNNLALAALMADGPPDFIWLLNPDTVVRPGAARSLIDFMRSHPRCGLCGPRLLNPDGSLQHGAFAFPGLAQLAIDTVPRLQARFGNSRLDGRYPPARYATGAPFRIGHPLGAAMLARGEAVAQVGPLDEGYEMYSEEVDWAMRMARAGWERWCVPAAVVTHYGGASSAQASQRAERIKWRSRMRYYAKHYPAWKRALAMRMVPAQFR